MAASTPSSFTLWLEEALSGWLVPGLALVLVAAAAALQAAGILAEGTAAAVAVSAAAVAAALFLLRSALATADRAGRALALAATVGTLILAAWPALEAVAPGRPLFEGDLASVGDALPVPGGVSGPVRVLVHTTLPQGGMPEIDFRIGGAAAPMEGQLERTVSYARVGRGTRSAVAHDHTDVYVEGRLQAGAKALTLDRASGQHAAPFHLAVFADPLPFRWAIILAVVVLLAAAAADVRLGTKRGAVAAVSGMALAFGLLVASSATPGSAMGTVFGGLLLGGIGGAVAGEVARLLARTVVPAPLPARRG